MLAHTAGVWEEFRGASLFITGGTGFFGHWLLSSFAAANQRFGLRARALVLTRDAAGFEKRAPELVRDSAISLHAGDVRSFDFLSGDLPSSKFSHIIHGATPASAALNAERPLEMQDIIIEGTRRVLDLARQSPGAKLLLCSSGAVYGRQPPEIERLSEDYGGGPDCLDPGSAYAEGKRLAELACATYARQYEVQAKIARCYAFLGPHLPPDAHFAAGNFLRDALAGRPIRVNGDGTPYRSYLHPTDLMIWLWTILARGQTARAYNVGSEEAIGIGDLARLIAKTVAPGTRVEILRSPVPGKLSARYVPSTARARGELGLVERIGLEEAIQRTAEWHRTRKAG